MIPPRSPNPRRVFVLGATGTIGRATVRALVGRGHDVVCFVRLGAGSAKLLAGATVRAGHVREPASLVRDGLRGEHFDALVSCLASRTGAPRDAWAIDHQAHVHALDVANQAGVSHVVLLSAICVQKPRLAFQLAKLAFEKVHATESMLVLDPATGRYDAAATPSTGTQTLFDFYASLLHGDATIERGDHAVF